MFSDELENISWEETTERIHAKTDADVRRALSKEHCNVEDFMALVSPAATPYLETMARLSKKYTEARLRFSYQQSHAAHHIDGRRNRERV